MIAGATLVRYRSAGVLVDTNLLLLYFVGAFDRHQISRFKRTAQFNGEDFDLLVDFLGRFSRVATTPHILTEVSNLAGQLHDAAKHGVLERLKAGLALLDEQFAPAGEISSHTSFARFGITDSAILHHARGRYLVLTDDFRLSQYLLHEGLDVINFNHLRMPHFFS